MKMRTIIVLSAAAFTVLLSLPQARAASYCDSNAMNLVTNCGFETGDFTGWTLSGSDTPGELNNLYGVEYGADPIDGITPNSGSYQSFFADLVANSTTLSQTLTTTPGQEYTVSFFLAQDTTPGTGQPPNSNGFSVSLDGTTLDTETDVPVEGYTSYSYETTVADASSLLNITLGNDLGQFLLDDVSVTPSPEPSASTLAALSLGLLVWFKRGASA